MRVNGVDLETVGWEAMGGDGREGDKTRVNEGALIEFVYTSSFPKWRV